jgi:hypothetical protein
MVAQEEVEEDLQGKMARTGQDRRVDMEEEEVRNLQWVRVVRVVIQVQMAQVAQGKPEVREGTREREMVWRVRMEVERAEERTKVLMRPVVAEVVVGTMEEVVVRRVIITAVQRAEVEEEAVAVATAPQTHKRQAPLRQIRVIPITQEVRGKEVRE